MKKAQLESGSLDIRVSFTCPNCNDYIKDQPLHSIYGDEYVTVTVICTCGCKISEEFNGNL